MDFSFFTDVMFSMSFLNNNLVKVTVVINKCAVKLYNKKILATNFNFLRNSSCQRKNCFKVRILVKVFNKDFSADNGFMFRCPLKL